MKYATAFLRRGKILIGPEDQTVVGLLIAGQPVQEIDPANIAALAAAIKNALDRSKTGVPHPDFRDWSVNDSPFHEAAGVRRWSEFVKRTKMVSIEADGIVRFIPHENKGAREGFVPAGCETVTAIMEGDLAGALLKAFERAIEK